MLSPILCNEQTLEDMALLAQQVDAPVAPYPLFFTASQCGGGGGTAGASFPQYFLPVQCGQDDVPSPSSNCLRIITPLDYDDGKRILLPNQINYLPSGSLVAPNAPNGNIFDLVTDKLFSWYVPPQYKMIFFEQNPSLHLPSTIPQWEMSGNSLQVDSCEADIKLPNGNSFWTVEPNTCTEPSNEFYHRTPWFIIIQEESFNSMLFDMCTSNREVLIGTNSLRQVWFPQSNGCDQFMTSQCTLSTLQNDPVCACFKQQAQLNAAYPNLNVSVCCFGQDDSKDINKACAFNEQAYKTKEMNENCCSFAECQTIAPSSELANLKCNGDLVDFPQQTVTVTPTVTPVQTVISYTTPTWIWIIIALSFVFWIVLLSLLAFLVKPTPLTANV